MNDGRRTPELAGQSCRMSRVGSVHLAASAAISSGHALGGGAVGLEDPHRMARAGKVVHDGAAHGAGTAQDRHEPPAIPFR